MKTNLVKVTDNLVQEAEALQALFVNVIFVVKLFVIGNRGKHDRDIFVSFAVEFLKKKKQF